MEAAGIEAVTGAVSCYLGLPEVPHLQAFRVLYSPASATPHEPTAFRVQARRACAHDPLWRYMADGTLTSTTQLAIPRYEVLDILRAFALGGILVINAMSILAVIGSTPAFTVDIPPADRALQDAILFFVESKFFTLFSLLFGISFAIQIGSAQRQGVAFLPRISRRLLTLGIFGIAHICLLWDGDILVIYAVTGLLLLLMRNLSTRALRRWIIALLAIPAVIVAGIFLWTIAYRCTQAGATSLASSDASLATSFADTTATTHLLEAGLLEGATYRIHTYIELLPLLVSRIPTVLAMFLLGICIGRSTVLTDAASWTSHIRRVRTRTLIAGFTAMTLILLATKFAPTTTALIAIVEDQYIAGPLLSVGYATAIVLAFINRPHLAIFAWLQPIGRMALTNYLMQSFVLTALAYGWGAGLALQLNGFTVIGICAALFTVQVISSHLWLSYFQYGPCEWLWRCATYWRWMPLRSS